MGNEPGKMLKTNCSHHYTKMKTEITKRNVAVKLRKNDKKLKNKTVAKYKILLRNKNSVCRSRN